MFVKNFVKDFKQELKEAREEGKKETFFNGLFLALSIKFDEITEKLKQQFLENLDLQNYKILILSSNSAEEAYSKIDKFASA